MYFFEQEIMPTAAGIQTRGRRAKHAA
jgi:hypothetical protein